MIAGQRPDFRRRHTVTLVGVDLFSTKYRYYTSLRGRNACLTATIPTFEAASWTPLSRPSLIDENGLDFRGRYFARTEDLDTRLFLRLFLTVHNSQQCQNLRDLNTGSFHGYTKGTVDYREGPV